MTTATIPALKSNLMISIEIPNHNQRNSSLSRRRRLVTNYSNFENYSRNRHNYSGRLRLQVAETVSSFPPEPFRRRGGGEERGFAAAAARLPNPNRRNCPRLVTNYSNYSVGRNRRLLQLPAACSSSSREPSPSPADIVSAIVFVTVVLGWFGWWLGWESAMSTQPCSSFISSTTSHTSNCCRCYRHCTCVEDNPEDDEDDDDELMGIL